MKRRRRIRILFGGLALAALLPVAASGGVRLQGVDASAYPTMRVSVVTAKPSAKAPVLRENGMPVVPVRTMNLARGKNVVVAVDGSQSMRGRALADATAGARAFIAAKPSSDRIAIVSIGRRARQLTPFSSTESDAIAALRAIKVDKYYGTALWDAVAISSEALGAETTTPSRVLILLTDGQEISSKATLDQAIAQANDAGVSVYTIGIESAKFQPAPLKRLAAATGGSYHRASSSAVLPKVYKAIAHELARTWRIEYATPSRPGDKLKLTASASGAGTATAAFVIPGRQDGLVGALLPGFLTSNAISTLALALLVALLVLAAAFSAMATREGAWLKSRLEPHVGEPEAAAKARSRKGRMAGFRKLASATDNAFADVKHWRMLRRLLERADLPLRPAEFVYLAAGCGLGLCLLVFATGAAPIAVVIALVAGAGLPIGYAWFRAAQRLKAFEEQLPDLLVTMAASLKAGHSFRQALQTVVEEGQEPASKEFNRVLTETRLGRPMDDALAEMGVRVGSKNLEFVITAVTIQRQVGGSLAGLFDMVADAVRQRQQFARKIKGLTAMGRMSAYVLIGLPFFIAGAVTLLNAEYMSPLYHTSTGHKLIVGGLIMMALGSAVLKKIVSFKG
jgi:tight adherence protein B